MAEEPLDAPAADPWGGTLPPDDVGQAGADTGVDENDIEMLPGDEEIEMPPDHVGHVNIGRPREVSQDEAHEKELADYSSYEKLEAYYKEIASGLPDNYRIPGNLDAINKVDPKSAENLDTYEELKAHTKRLLEQRDLQEERNTQLEARYGDDISGDPGLRTYDQLADYYKNLHTVLHDGMEPSMEGLDTYERLKTATYEVMESRDKYLKQHGLLEENDESHTDDPGEDGADHVDKPVYDPVAREKFKSVFGYDPGEDAVEHMDDHADDPVGDLWMP